MKSCPVVALLYIEKWQSWTFVDICSDIFKWLIGLWKGYVNVENNKVEML